jgi:hypothetical protein
MLLFFAMCIVESFNKSARLKGRKLQFCDNFRHKRRRGTSLQDTIAQLQQRISDLELELEHARAAPSLTAAAPAQHEVPTDGRAHREDDAPAQIRSHMDSHEAMGVVDKGSCAPDEALADGQASEEKTLQTPIQGTAFLIVVAELGSQCR